MKRWTVFLVLSALLGAVLALAVCQKGDDDDAPDHTCEEFCARAGECGTECVPTDCLTYCQENMSMADLTCVDLAPCDQFNECSCSGLDDDDDADDDDGDDTSDDTDDDTGDDTGDDTSDDTGDDTSDDTGDDTGDDDTETELYYDDGTYESQVGCVSGKGPCRYANVFFTSGPAQVARARYMISSQGGILIPKRLGVEIYNAAPGYPTGAPLASVSDRAPAFDVWRDVFFDPGVDVEGAFAVVINQTSGFASLAIDTSSTFRGYSYLTDDYGGTWTRADMAGNPDIAGNFMIRAVIRQ